MKNIAAFFIKYTSVVAILVAGIVILGVSSYTQMPKEAFPQIEIPYIIVTTIYKGVAPADIEKLVTKPIEKKIKSISGIKKVNSTSAESVSMVVIEFDANVKIDNALQKVRDKVSLARSDLPKDVEDPEVKEISFDDIPMMVISLAANYGLDRLKNIADDLKDEFETVPGVLAVNVVGGLEREIQVLPDEAKLRNFGLSLDQYTYVLNGANINVPGGTMDLGDMKYLIRIPSEFKTIKDIENTVLLSYQGKNIYVKDVAKVKDTYKKINSKSRINLKEAITISIQKRSGENIIKVSDGIKKILNERTKKLPVGTRVELVTDMSQGIRDQVDEMENSLILGLVLVIAVLYLFMGFRNAVIVSVVIPLSMLVTIIILKMMGWRLNFIVLFSLILVLGMLVDNAIVVVENIFRHLQMGRPRKTAAEVGAAEVFGPIVGSTLTTVVGFLPMAFWPGMIGKFMSFLPITVIIGISASLLMAIMVNPVLCALYLRNKTFKKGEHPEKTISDKVNEWFENSRKYYETALAWSLDHYKLVLKWAMIAFFISLVLLVKIPKQFFPDTPPEEFFIDLKLPVGSALSATDSAVQKVEDYLNNNKNIQWFVSNIGSKGGSGGSMMSGGGSESSDVARITVKFKPDRERKEKPEKIIDKVRIYLKTIPGITAEIAKEQHGPPSGAKISIKIVGDDFKELTALSAQIKKVMNDTKGVVDIRDDFVDSSGELHIDIDREKAAFYGLSDLSIALAARSAFNGTVATKLRDGNDEYDIVVKLDDSYKKDLNAIRSISIPTRTGQHVQLEKIANVRLTNGMGAIQREDYYRVINVMADTDSKTLPFVALNKIRKVLDKVELPTGYRFEFTGENQEMENSFAFLSTAFKMAVILIAVVLVAQFNSFVLPLIICITIMLSIIGVAIGLTVTWRPFGLMAFLGIVSLAGVVVNNGIILIDYILVRRSRGYPKRESIIKACSIRMRPVMLTAVTTILGLVPVTIGFSIDFKKLAITFGGESSAYWGPMGAAVIFGMLVATVLTLIVVPCLYNVLDDWSQKYHEKKAKNMEQEDVIEVQLTDEQKNELAEA